MISKEPEPNWEVYKYVIGLFELWQTHGRGRRSSEYYRRLCELAGEHLPTPDYLGIYSILNKHEPSQEQVEYVALTFAKRAVELHWELPRE